MCAYLYQGEVMRQRRAVFYMTIFENSAHLYGTCHICTHNDTCRVISAQDMSKDMHICMRLRRNLDIYTCLIVLRT